MEVEKIEDSEIDCTCDRMTINAGVEVIEGLDTLSQRIASMENYNSDVHAVISDSIESMMKVAAIGNTYKPKTVDLQSNESWKSIQKATVESIGETAKSIWAKIVAAIRRAYEWFKGILARLFGLNKKTQDVARKKIDKAKAEIEALEKDPNVDMNKNLKEHPVTLSPEYLFFLTEEGEINQANLNLFQKELNTLVNAYDDWANGNAAAGFYKETISPKEDPSLEGSKRVEASIDYAGKRFCIAYTSHNAGTLHSTPADVINGTHFLEIDTKTKAKKVIFKGTYDALLRTDSAIEKWFEVVNKFSEYGNNITADMKKAEELISKMDSEKMPQGEINQLKLMVKTMTFLANGPFSKTVKRFIDMSVGALMSYNQLLEAAKGKGGK